MRVKDLMKSPFVIEEDMTLAEASKIMADKEIGCLIYVSKDKILGIVTEGDLLRNFQSKKNVSQVMSKELIVTSPDARVEEALDLMRDNKIKRLPVVDGEGKLVGIITTSDMATHFEEIGEDFFFDD